MMFERLKRHIDNRKNHDDGDDLLKPAQEMACVSEESLSNKNLAIVERVRCDLPKLIKQSAHDGKRSTCINLVSSYGTDDSNEHLTSVIGWLTEQGYNAYISYHFWLNVEW